MSHLPILSTDYGQGSSIGPIKFNIPSSNTWRCPSCFFYPPGWYFFFIQEQFRNNIEPHNAWKLGTNQKQSQPQKYWHKHFKSKSKVLSYIHTWEIFSFCCWKHDFRASSGTKISKYSRPRILLVYTGWSKACAPLGRILIWPDWLKIQRI